jgi:hypothetical protein
MFRTMSIPGCIPSSMPDRATSRMKALGAPVGAAKFRSDQKRPATGFPARAFWILRCSQYAGDLPDVSIFPKSTDQVAHSRYSKP